MPHDLIIQQPDTAPATPAGGTELLLLFHGVGASARDLQPLAEALAELRPKAWVVSLQAPHPSEFGQGWQWFSGPAGPQARGHAAGHRLRGPG